MHYLIQTERGHRGFGRSQRSSNASLLHNTVARAPGSAWWCGGVARRLGADSQLLPCDHLKQLFQRAKTARQRNEGVRCLRHPGLPLVHVGHDPHLADTLAANFHRRQVCVWVRAAKGSTAHLRGACEWRAGKR